MTDNERDFHQVKKLYEHLHLTLRHFLPLGKPLPDSYRDTWEAVYSLVDSGALDHLAKEPIDDEVVRQLDIFTHVSPDELANRGNGTDVDHKEVKK